MPKKNHLIAAALLACTACATAAPPDLTDGDIPRDSVTINLDINSDTLRINGPARDGLYGGLVFLNDHNLVDEVIGDSRGFRSRSTFPPAKPQATADR